VRPVPNAPPGVEVVEIDEPEGDEELVRVAATGICASDLILDLQPCGGHG
jgi:Zn-dependent alcohol dehydrogenase